MVFYFKRSSLICCKRHSGKLQINSNNSAVQRLGFLSSQCSNLGSNPNRTVNDDYQDIDSCDKKMTINVVYGPHDVQKEVVSNELYNMENTVTSNKQLSFNRLYGANFNATDQHKPGSLKSARESEEAFDNEIYSFADANPID